MVSESHDWSSEASFAEIWSFKAYIHWRGIAVRTVLSQNGKCIVYVGACMHIFWISCYGMGLKTLGDDVIVQ